MILNTYISSEFCDNADNDNFMYGGKGDKDNFDPYMVRDETHASLLIGKIASRAFLHKRFISDGYGNYSEKN